MWVIVLFFIYQQNKGHYARFVKMCKQQQRREEEDVERRRKNNKKFVNIKKKSEIFR